MKNGKLDSFDNIETIVGKYSQLSEFTEAKILFNNNHPRRGNGSIKFVNFEIRDSFNILCNEFSIGDNIHIKFTVNNFDQHSNCQIGIQILTPDGIIIYHFINLDSKYVIELTPGLNNFTVILKDIRLYPNSYSVTISIADKFGSEEFDHIVSAISFKITDGLFYTNRDLPISSGLHFIKPVWDSH
jgi:lipopolysaccharide transport system ATP-binding protein